MNRQPHLSKIVRAIRTAGALAHRLDGGQQQADQNTDDGNDHQEFHEGKAVLGP